MQMIPFLPARNTVSFRSDVGTFLDPDVVEQAVEVGRYERAPMHTLNGKHVQYLAFTDPSGGRGDAFTLAIAHLERPKPSCSMCSEACRRRLIRQSSSQIFVPS